MNVKQRALRLIGKKKLDDQFDTVCQQAIESAIAETTAHADGIHDPTDILKSMLEDRFTKLRDRDRLIRAFMVIDCQTRPWRGIVNVQFMTGDGYARYQFEIVRSRINVTVSHVSPRYV
jgi:hypothetical protein